MSRTMSPHRRTLRRHWWILGVLVSAVPVSLEATASDRFPDDEWTVAPSPEDAGWSREKLQIAEQYADSIDTAAVLIVHDGLVVHQWGRPKRVYKAHSIRKSILSALYGIYVAEGVIELDWTLAELAIDDNGPSLTATEKTATVRDLLTATSGIYHPALYESPGMVAKKPPRGSHPPGTHWVYNNWDFNALGTIFERAAGTSLYAAFDKLIATPLQMQDFVRKRHTGYYTGDLSVHPAYPFRLSARDLARFGLLFARNGRWNGEQIVPEGWVDESTTAYSGAYASGGYGYMWWVADGGRHLPNVVVPDGAFSAQGANGHYLVVIPQWDLVVVHRVNTYIGKHVTPDQFGQLLYLILDARPAILAPHFDIAPPTPQPVDTIEVSKRQLMKFAGSYRREGTRDDVVARIEISVAGSELNVRPEYDEPFVLLPIGKNRFQVPGTRGTFVEFTVNSGRATRGAFVSDLYEPFTFVRLD